MLFIKSSDEKKKLQKFQYGLVLVVESLDILATQMERVEEVFWCLDIL